jgi:hypothetical protein
MLEVVGVWAHRALTGIYVITGGRTSKPGEVGSVEVEPSSKVATSS